MKLKKIHKGKKMLEIEKFKILVISNNSFSENNNNGKTLASFFSEFDSENIAQLYFSSEVPSGTKIKKFYRISDKEVFNSFFKNINCGNPITKFENSTSNEIKNNYLLEYFKNSNFIRLLREIIWKYSNWKNKSFDNWLEAFSPDIIFLCAGDSGFSYRIANYISSKYKTKIIVYITDDYILPRKTVNIFWWIRRNYIYSKMYNMVKKSHLLITISDKMREKYKEVFNKNSFVAVNMTESLKRDIHIEKNKYNKLTLIYAGGLHFKRYETLILLCNVIKKYNENSIDLEIFLEIYSNQIPNKNILDKLNIDSCSKFLGTLNKEELIAKLNKADIPVHVESFDLKCIESTKLSISTKIPEYLSLSKPILAIGPKEIASLEYLKDIAYCITEPNILYESLSILINNHKLQEDLSMAAYSKYTNCHDREVLIKNFKKSISNCINN